MNIDKEKVIELSTKYYDSVCDEIEHNCIGRRNAKTSHDIARKVGLITAGKRVIQMIVKRMNIAGIPVISYDGSETPEKYKGFFIPETRKELEVFSEKFKQQAKVLKIKAEEIENTFFNYKGVKK